MSACRQIPLFKTTYVTPPNPPTEPYRIMLGTTELRVGGAERCLTNLALGLDQDYLDPSVFCLAPRPTGEQAVLVERLEGAGIPVHFLGVTKWSQFAQAIRGLRKLLTDQSPHILQTFLWHANIVGAIAAWRARIPRVFAGLRVAERRWSRWLAYRLACSNVRQFVCVSDSVREIAHCHGRVPLDRLSTIPNGIDLARLKSSGPVDLAEYGLPTGKRALVCAGRFDPQKGFDWFLPLAPTILSRLPEYDLMMVGDGPQRGELEAITERLGIADRVHFIGWQRDVPAILAVSDLVVIPSRWEGMSNVLLETMAVKRPVVAANVEGVEEVLGPLAEQQTIHPSDNDGIVNKIIKLAHDPEERVRLGQQNSQRIAQHFALDHMIESYQNLYLASLSDVSETGAKKD